jgi:Ca2+-binding RTX toxin-like protein
MSGEATTGATGEFMTLKVSTGANWIPPVSTSGAYLGVVDITGTAAADSWLVLERTGSGASTAYKGYKFNEKTDAQGVATLASSPAQTISLTDLLKMETDNAVDFNGDSAIGDGVSQVIASPRVDDNEDGKITSADTSKGIQLVKLASGAVAIDMSGEATTGSSTDLVTLQLPTGAIWQPPVTTSGAYLGVFERLSTDTLLVIERTGSGPTATFKTYEFDAGIDANGDPTGSAAQLGTIAQTLSSTQLLSMESMMGVDFNGDTNVEQPKQMIGTGAAETLIGGVGSDLLRGGAGRDVLTGGLGWDTFDFSDLVNMSAFTSGVTDVITDLAIGDDEILFNLAGSFRIKTMGGYSNLQSFAKAADKLLDGSTQVVFGKVGPDGYLFMDPDGTGISAIIQLVGVKECPSISTLVEK